MKIFLVAIGKLKEPWARVACDDYMGRIRPYAKIEHLEVKDEGSLHKHLKGQTWILDEQGKMLSSVQLASQLEDLQQFGEGTLTLILGGPDGLSADMKKKSQFLWSLSSLTFPYQMARLIVLEQVYRAFRILKGEPYHRS